MKSLITKISNKIKGEVSQFTRAFKTRYNYQFKRSDKSRWSQKKELHPNWDERSSILAKQISSDSKVFEFGAGRLALKHMLPEGCTYLHSDIVKRNDHTLVIDLNKELPSIPQVDYVVFSGVLEYVYEAGKLVKHISGFTSHIVMSYATTDAFANPSTRRYHGWVSNLSNSDIYGLANDLGWNIESIGTWRGQTLYHLKK